ncbi:Lrp/AsnC ligand binding domain-containing protein [Pseudomonas syringae]|nr:Lrp/AsnC ligand binding domain-containing protein [Pseudomonas syringae]
MYISVRLLDQSVEAASHFESKIRQFSEVRAIYQYGANFEYVLRLMVEDVSAVNTFLHRVVVGLPAIIASRNFH